MTSRRGFFAACGGAGAALVGYGLGSGVNRVAFAHERARAGDLGDDATIEGEDTPLEDLMREHAVLERLLMVYEESAHRLESGVELAPEVPAKAAGIIRRYIEDHHERDEEQHVFPRLVRVGVTVDLVDTLLAQHASGRRLTSEILARSTVASLRDPSDRSKLVHAMRGFIRMYRPHAARENTVLFPAFRKAVSQPEYMRLRETLEKSELDAFGPNLFDNMLEQVCALERELGMYELASFTPGDHE